MQQGSIAKDTAAVCGATLLLILLLLGALLLWTPRGERPEPPPVRTADQNPLRPANVY
jgi:hypothetical protein